MDDPPVASGAAEGERASEDLVAVVDASGLITAAGSGVRRLLGYEPDEIVGHAAAGLLAADLPLPVRRQVAELRACTGELALRHRDGSRIVLRLRAAPLTAAGRATSWLVTAAAPADPAGPSDPTAALLSRTLVQLPVPVAVYDREARLVAANESMTRVMGKTEEEMRGLTLGEIEPSWPFDAYDRLQRQVLRTGELVFNEEHGRAPGETQERSWSVFISPLRDGSGSVFGVSAAVFDTTEQYWARRRLTVLNEASLRIGSTLDVNRTAEELAEVAVSGFADFVTVDLLDSVARGDEPEPVLPAGPVVLRRTAQRSVLEGCPEAVLRPGDEAACPAGSPSAQVLATGRSARYRSDDPGIRQWTESSRVRSETAGNVIHSVMMVPLRARGVTLGLVHFLRHRTPQTFSEDDLMLAEEIIARAAVCVDNARRYTCERRTALALQRSLLPERLSQSAALEVAHRYLPAGSGTRVGGDWFDVIPLSGARIALVVGDVVGRGIRASATMGRLRTAVRTLADVELAPDELLTRLDDLVLRLDREEGPEVRAQSPEVSGEVGATCLYAVYDPVSRRCTMARAGHVPPAVVAADGTVRFLDLPAGPPLGLGGLPFEAAEIELDEGSLIALYTDGLIETADRDIDVGLGLLRDALRPATDLEQACDDVLRTVLTRHSDDDVVLVLARTRALDANRVRTWQVPSDPAAVAVARRLASEQLAAWALEEQVFATELIVSELVTNAIRYGAPPIQLRLICHDTLICEVSDGSNTAPHLRQARVFDEGGRGLLLVAQVSERWGSRQTSAGKTIWTEQRL